MDYDVASHPMTRGKRVLVDGDRMPGAAWFPEAPELFRDRPELDQ